MKKIALFVALITAMLCVFSACSGKTTLALISPDGKEEMGAFGQSAWEGIVKYAEENNISKSTYQPEDMTDTASIEKSIDNAIAKKAQFIVMPGYEFSQATFNEQSKNPDIKFVIIDSTPMAADGTQQIAENTVAVKYAEQEAGFMAGYATIYDGYTQLGFVGGEAIDAVMRYGYGFVQGAQYAANELSIPENTISIKYCYTNSFDESDATFTLAQQWYLDGTECIFTAAGKAGYSVMKAAEETGGKVIGCDTDQAPVSVSVIASAEKCLDATVYMLLDNYYEGTFPGGQLIEMNASNGGVALAMDNSRFVSFTQEQYDDLAARLMSNTDNITSSIKSNKDAAGANIALTDLGTPLITVVVTEI